MSIAVAIVEDNPEFREELAAAIEAAPGIRCVAVFNSCEDLLKQHLDRFDLVLLDINLPRMSGVDCASKLRGSGFGKPLVMLTVNEDTETLFAALQAGATGYLLKRSSLEVILESIRDAHNGGSPMTPQIARRVIEHFHRPPKFSSELQSLTPREREVLDFLAKGHLYKQIGVELGISLDTVRAHVRHIYEKLQVSSRMAAMAKWQGR